jgi:predicted secreted Zn-dependent protease
MNVRLLYTRMAIIACRESIHCTDEVERRNKFCAVTDVKIRINVTGILPTSSEQAASKTGYSSSLDTANITGIYGKSDISEI